MQALLSSAMTLYQIRKDIQRKNHKRMIRDTSTSQNTTLEKCPKFEMFSLYNFSLHKIAWMSIIFSNESIKETNVIPLMMTNSF